MKYGISVVAAMAALSCLAPGNARGAAAATLPQVEQEALAHLNAGRQSQAERLLARQAANYQDVLRAIDEITATKPGQAVRLPRAVVERHRDKQRLFFLMAACDRSRFDIEAALPVFLLVYGLDPESAAGLCAYHVARLDMTKLRRGSFLDADANFTALARLADAHPDDVVIRWMAAVQCRSWNRNKEGIAHYQKILEKWSPGPVLVHQTYANVLHEAGRFDEALIERVKAVELEPAGWSYDGLANTLHRLRRFEEANKAHAIAVRQAPDRVLYWTNWAITRYDEKAFDETIALAKRATELDPRNRTAWHMWGKALEAQGKLPEAQEKLDRAKVRRR